MDIRCSPPERLDAQARRPSILVPIRVEFETDTHRIRDCFVWNLNEDLIQPEVFARIFCADLELPFIPWAETVANQIRAQLEEHEGIAALDLSVDSLVEVGAQPEPGEEIPECRVMLSVRLQMFLSYGVLVDHCLFRLMCRLQLTIFKTTLSGTSCPR